MSAADDSVARLARRVSNIPQLLTQTLAEKVVPAVSSLASGRFVVTGAGIAAGPARFFATYLRHVLGLSARYCPPSAFAYVGARPEGENLLVFSQGLSANAQMALAHAGAYQQVVLFSATRPDPKGSVPERQVERLLDAGGQLVSHGPKREDGMLVRVLGPNASIVQAVRWASGLAEIEGLDASLARLPQRVAKALERAEGLIAQGRVEALFGDVAFVTSGGYGDACRGLSWKWMEGLWTSEPPFWDVLQAVHGPLQTFWEREMTLLALCGPPGRDEPLLDRLEGIVHPERHTMLRLRAMTPGALAIFEHGAALDRLMIGALEARPRDLNHWPAKGADEPLYGLSEPLS